MPSHPYPHPASSARAQAPDREEVTFPASYAQQRLWFLHHLAEGVAAYNIPIGLRLRGRLDVDALERALAEILRRHDVLRTRFVEKGGAPHQKISPPGPVVVPEDDLRSLPESDRESEASRITASEAHAPFDLARGPLVRFRRLRLGDQENLLLVTMHHIVSDGWSVDILLRELSQLYEAYGKGGASPLPDLPIQYADYSIWQRDWLRGEILEAQLSYWRRQLAGAPTVLDLPADRIRPATPTFRGGSRSALYSPRLLDRLKALSQREGVTLFMTLLAGFQALLSRLTQQDDLLVGSPIIGRNQVQTEGLIGFFVNTLAVRGDVSGDPTFRELVRRTREVALEAYAHQDLPFERLVVELRPARELGHNPLLQVMFQVRPSKGRSPRLPGLEVAPFHVATTSAKFDLNVTLAPRSEGLSCAMEYSADILEPATVDRWLKHYEVLLEAAVADPDRRVSRLPILTAAEERRLVVDWNATATPYPRDETVHGLFEEQVEKTPQAEAVVFGEERLTYGQLNERANRLARYLRNRRVGPEVLVGLCVERSVEMVVGLLGILKAGGAYLPLDPSYPRQRLAFMLEDTATRVVLTQESLAESLPEGDFERVRLDADWPEIARESGENLPGQATAENLAYVIYTSGSTGTPKGVSVRHRSIVRLVREIDYARFETGGVFLQFAPISFDASTFEVWGALLNGAQVVIMQPGLPSLEELAAALKRYEVSTLWLTAGLFHQMAETQIDALRGVRQLLAGGDVLSVPHVEKVLRELPDCRLINGYGPTENTTFTCCHTIRRDEPLGANVPIGRPIANTRVFILDRNCQPVPIGVPGELYIGGDGLARDYFRRPELTAKKFVPYPFGGDGGERLYRTGDRARYRADGTVEFLGRLDDQVKIRGFRIEPGEIESVLARHPAVEKGVVLPREDTPGDRRLVAYVVPGDGTPPAESELRGFLKRTLPDYMVPSVFLFLDDLPLTSSGKLDREALPPPERASREVEDAYVAPRDPIEEALAEIWARVLGVERVSVEDDFFLLGGHSLLAMQVISRVRDAFGLEVPLRALFEAPTVAGLALAMTQLPPENLGPEEISRSLAEITASAGEEKPAADGEYR